VACGPRLVDDERTQAILTDSRGAVIRLRRTQKNVWGFFRFVELALQRPDSTRQLKDRAALAFHAAIGLDCRQRARVEELLSKHLKAIDSSQEQQENVALCLVHSKEFSKFPACLPHSSHTDGVYPG
jgi:hypothetical protein